MNAFSNLIYIFSNLALLLNENDVTLFFYFEIRFFIHIFGMPGGNIEWIIYHLLLWPCPQKAKWDILETSKLCQLYMFIL